MSEKRLVNRYPAQREDIGDLVTRSPKAPLRSIDPFLFLNHHGPQTYPSHNRGLPFGPHPHRGFETVTFILDGELMHQDSAGHESIIGAGGVQWMTAGRGLVHAELSPPSFKEKGGPLEILQLWVNLPAALKMTAPRYIGLQKSDISALALDEGRAVLHLVAGEWSGQKGAIPSLTGLFLSTIEIAAGSSLALGGLSARNPFLYVVRGTIETGGGTLSGFQLAELDRQGDRIALKAVEDSVLLFGHGTPLGEPIASYGPFVMNTQAEIHQAIRDYQAGKFD